MEEEVKYTHPSYGMLSLSYPQGGERVLFGSAIKHTNTVTIRLCEGEEYRSLHETKQFGRHCLFEIEMSKAQFADFISSAGFASGVPCTIRKRVDVEGFLPEPPFRDEKAMIRNEFVEHNHKINRIVKVLIENVKKKFTQQTLKKADKAEVIGTLETIQREIGNNTTFIMDQFMENTEKISTQAKAEIEAYFDSRVRQIAYEAMNTQNNLSMIQNPVSLEDKTSEDSV